MSSSEVSAWLGLPVLIFIAAVLYASVGHAGASGYLAAMALLGVPPEVMRPSALLLNVIVATIGTIRFHRADAIRWRTLTPFVLGSIPGAYLGGWLPVPGDVFKPLLGVVLAVAAIRLMGVSDLRWWSRRRGPTPPSQVARPPSDGVAVVIGAVIGLLSGLTGTGGGIFLSPVLVLMGWATVREAAGLSVAFILANSIAGLMGQGASLAHIPPVFPLWAVAAITGGLIGSTLGSRWLGRPALRRLLAVVLLIAAGKLIFMREAPPGPPPPNAVADMSQHEPSRSRHSET